jgi:hypothetical protein
MTHVRTATLKKVVTSTPPSKKHKPCMEKKPDTMWFDSDDRSIECPICFNPFDAEIFMVRIT